MTRCVSYRTDPAPAKLLKRARTAVIHLLARRGVRLGNDKEGSLRGRILVVDDLADAASSLAMICSMYGAQTRTARDGIQALKEGAEFRPNVILMDISMPHMDGYEAARRIRQEEWGREAILVALTGWGRKADVDAALAAGFDGHLLKPVETDAMVRVISELTARRRGGLSSE